MNVNDFSPRIETPDYRQVRVAIGGDGKKYTGANSHFDITGVYQAGPNIVMLLLPDSVAEYYRQEGRRNLQSELRDLLHVSRR